MMTQWSHASQGYFRICDSLNHNFLLTAYLKKIVFVGSCSWLGDVFLGETVNMEKDTGHVSVRSSDLPLAVVASVCPIG